LIPRALIVLCLLAGLLAPKGAVVLAGAVPGMVQVVICTGHGLDVITLDAEGNPRRVEHDLPCSTVHALPQTGRVALGEAVRTVWFTTIVAPVATVAAQSVAFLRPLPRAPPRL
jgi:hypothetical protein